MRVRHSPPWAAFGLLFALSLAAGPAAAQTPLFQWDFNGPGTGTTVAPVVGSGGVLTMSQEHVDDFFNLSDPAATSLYSAAGTGVFYNSVSNPNDRAFNNSGTVYAIDLNGGPGDVAGMVSSDNIDIVPAANNTLADTSGTHGKITITTWVKLDSGQLAANSQQRLLAFGSQGYDGQNGAGVNGTYLGFFNTGGQNTLQFKSNGAAGTGTSGNGFVGNPNIINQFKSDWMFVAVTYDSTVAPTSGNTNVQIYLGDKVDPLGGPASSGVLPFDPNAQMLATGGPVNLDNNFVYMGNRIAGQMNRGLGALVDDVRIYDGILSQNDLDRIRQNLGPSGALQGDFNGDGVVDAADIMSMMQALSDLNAYHTNHPSTDLVALGDFNGDGKVTNADLQGLLNHLSQSVPSASKGDFNFDGVVNAADIAAMMQALADIPGYQATHGNLSPQGLATIGDFNTDGVVNNLDLQGLLNALADSAGGGMVSAVPEPSSWVVSIVGAAVLIAAKRGNSRRRSACR